MKQHRIKNVALAAGAALAAIIAGPPSPVCADDFGAPTPTYYKDVLPIFQNNCIQCHRQGQLAPMPLDDYAALRPWVKSIRKAVSERTMPPWFADKNYGHWLNDISLNDEQIVTITRWTNGGAPAGNPGDAPAPKTYNEKWQLGEPDQVFTMTKSHTLPGEGPDEYKYFEIPTNFTEDRWITSFEVMPGNREVVHHVIVFVKEPGKSDAEFKHAPGEGGPVKYNSFRPESDTQLKQILERQMRAVESQAGRPRPEAPLRVTGMLGGMAPGMPPWMARPDEGRLIKAGSTLVFQMHYHPSGKAATDQTSIGVRFAKHVPAKQRYTTGIFNLAFAVPPGDGNFRVEASHKVNEDIHILSFMPHMHLRGKDYEYKAIYPDGREETLLSVPKYDFNWQLVYDAAKPIAIPKGTTIQCVAHFDNSAENPNNPDPQAVVRFGEPTTDEMMIGWFDFTRDAEIFGAIEG
ncbi:cytochrome c [Candidatus Sumerlaeota bacterium]|nr:cytochrome c [Candidatus Sumerlaeota bacterium]